MTLTFTASSKQWADLAANVAELHNHLLCPFHFTIFRKGPKKVLELKQNICWLILPLSSNFAPKISRFFY